MPNENEVIWQVTESGWLYVIRDAEPGETVVTISVDDLQQFVAELSARGVDSGPVEPVGQAGWKATIVNSTGWLKVSSRGRVFRMTAEQVLNRLLPALAFRDELGLTMTVEHYERPYWQIIAKSAAQS
ncbi:MAG TPA: hypothetical protein VFH56_09825 [Acidimicrobiales bacterium]|nr:hypothetical protein [Acidimicrobiales bacterium]